MIYDSILGTIGRTPIVKINRLAPAHVTMYVKCEFFNPLSSVKDRLAIAIIEDAERRGTLKPGQTVVEATSGNTGIALAMVCAAKGYPFVATMAESFSVERRKIMRMLGAKVILTPAAERGSGMVRKAEELAKKHGWFLARQFEHEANPAYHRNPSGPEILQDFAGRRLDFFVTGWGTGGTLTGTGEMIRLARPEVQIIASEPAAAALLAGKPFTPRKIQDWTPDFVPKVLKHEVPHRIVTVTDAEAVERSRLLACGSERWVVAGHGRAGPGDRRRALLRYLRQLPRQLLRLDRARLNQSGHRQAVSADVSGPVGRGHRARGFRDRAPLRDRATGHGDGPLPRGHGRARVRGAVSGRRAAAGVHFGHRRGSALCHRAALDPARGDHPRSRLEGRQLQRRAPAAHGAAPGAQAGHRHLSFRRRMGAALRARADPRGHEKARRRVRVRVRDSGLPRSARSALRECLRRQLLSLHLARHGPLRSRCAR